MSPLASCEVGVGVGVYSAQVADGGAVVHGAVVHGAVGVGGDAVAHDVVGVGDGGVHDVVGEVDGDGNGVHGVEGEGDGDGVHDVVGEDGGVGGVHGVEVEGDMVVHTVGVVVEMGGETVEEGVCKVHVQNAAQEGSKVQAGNDHWVKSRHLGHHGIAMQDKENMFLSKPVGSMVMITAMICKKQVYVRCAACIRRVRCIACTLL